MTVTLCEPGPGDWTMQEASVSSEGGKPTFVEVSEPGDQALQDLMHTIIKRVMKVLTHQGAPAEVAGVQTRPRTTWIRAALAKTVFELPRARR